MVVIEFGNVTLLRLVQTPNAFLPICFIVFGIVTDVMFSH